MGPNFTCNDLYQCSGNNLPLSFIQCMRKEDENLTPFYGAAIFTSVFSSYWVTDPWLSTDLPVSNVVPLGLGST